MPEYFNLPELRALPDMSNTVRFPDVRCEAAAAYVVSRIESVVDSSFVRRPVTETHDGAAANAAGSTIALRTRHPFQVTALTQNGVALDAGGLAELVIDGIFLRRRVSGSWASWRVWQPGLQNLVITYLTGFSAAPPGDVKEAALQATRDRLLTLDTSSSYNARAKAVTNEYGTTSLATADQDHPFGIPDVDAVVVQYREQFATVVG